MGIGDHHVHRSMHGKRRVPGKRLVEAVRPPLAVDQQIFRTARKAEMGSRQRLVGAEMLRPAVRCGMCLNRLGIWRLETKATRAVHRADQHLKYVQRARRLEPVGMRRQAAHGVKRYRTPHIAGVRFAAHIRPWLLDRNRLFEGDARDFGSKATDNFGRDARFGGDGFRCVFRIEILLGEELEGGRGPAPVFQLEMP